MANPGKPRKISPQLWALVAAELDAGSTYEQVQRELAQSTPPIEISISMLQKYRAEDAKRKRQPPPDMDATLARLQARTDARRGVTPESSAPAAPLDVEDQEGVLGRLLSDTHERLERARQLGDAVIAAREAKNMAELTRQLAGARKVKAGQRDVITATRAEVEGAMRSVRDKAAAVQQRIELQGGLMCPGCGAELTAAHLGVDLTPPKPEA